MVRTRSGSGENGRHYIYLEYGNLPVSAKKVMLGPLAPRQEVDFSFAAASHGKTESGVGPKDLLSLWPPAELPPPSTNIVSFSSNVLTGDQRQRQQYRRGDSGVCGRAGVSGRFVRHQRAAGKT